MLCIRPEAAHSRNVCRLHPQGLATGGAGEESGENGPRQEAEAAAAAAVAEGVVHAGSAANLARLGRDQELRRLQVSVGL